MSDQEIVDRIIADIYVNRTKTQECDPRVNFRDILFHFINEVRMCLKMPGVPMQEILKNPCYYWDETLYIMKHNRETMEYLANLPF